MRSLLQLWYSCLPLLWFYLENNIICQAIISSPHPCHYVCTMTQHHGIIVHGIFTCGMRVFAFLQFVWPLWSRQTLHAWTQFHPWSMFPIRPICLWVWGVANRIFLLKCYPNMHCCLYVWRVTLCLWSQTSFHSSCYICMWDDSVCLPAICQATLVKTDTSSFDIILPMPLITNTEDP